MTRKGADSAVTAQLRELASHGCLLVDERSAPSFRSIFGRLLAASGSADFAVARVRLAAIDLSDNELSHVRRCRLLLGRLDAEALATANGADPHRTGLGSLRRLHTFVTSGRIEIRAAGIQEWAPDFTIFRELTGLDGFAHRDVTITGIHHFARATPVSGPALTNLCCRPEAAELATDRFDELFDRGYDVTSVVADLLAELTQRSTAAGPEHEREARQT